MKRMGDETAIETWLAREQAEWSRSLATALDEAILHLQNLIFEEGWDLIVAQAGSQEAALRESVLHYERGLANLFSFIRASGSLADAVAWSTLKAEFRRTALNSGVEITLRTALETGVYASERTPLGDHARYKAWVRGLMVFLCACAGAGPAHPGLSSPQETRLEWAYSILALLEDQQVFHERFSVFLHQASDEALASALSGSSIDAVIRHQADLLSHPRFDLLLNTALIWLANAGGRGLEYLPVEE